MAHITGDLADSRFKAFALDTPLVTPSGWRTIEDVGLGDWLFDEQGQPVRVIGVTGVTTYRTCQAARFDDGAELVAHSGNVWYALNTGRRIRNHASVVDWRDAWPLVEVVRGPAFLRRAFIGKDHLNNWSIPLTRPLRIADADLPLPPYVVGAWLGDGCKDNATMTTCDPWMLDEFRRQGMAVTARRARAKDRSIDFGFRPDDGLTRVVTSTGRGKTTLRDIGILQNKHVPSLYLRGSRDQRLALLRGIMDTDGYRCPRGTAAIEQRDRVIADGVVELARSLGWRAFVTPQSRPHPNRPGDTYHFWHVNFKPDMCPYALPRKAEQWTRETVSHTRFTHRTLVAIEECTRRRVRGIAVEGSSGFFLAGRGMVPV